VDSSQLIAQLRCVYFLVLLYISVPWEDESQSLKDPSESRRTVYVNTIFKEAELVLTMTERDKGETGRLCFHEAIEGGQWRK